MDFNDWEILLTISLRCVVLVLCACVREGRHTASTTKTGIGLSPSLSRRTPVEELQRIAIPHFFQTLG